MTTIALGHSTCERYQRLVYGAIQEHLIRPPMKTSKIPEFICIATLVASFFLLMLNKYTQLSTLALPWIWLRVQPSDIQMKLSCQTFRSNLVDIFRESIG